MRYTNLISVLVLIVAPFIAVSCNAQKPKLTEFEGTFTGKWELDIAERSIEGIADNAKKRELDNRDWEVYNVPFTVESQGGKALYIPFQGAKLKLDLKKIKSEKDDGVMEHTALFTLDVASVQGKQFSYRSADGALDVTFTIREGKKELEAGVRVDSKFELPEKEFEGEYLVDCQGTFRGDKVTFAAKLEISFPK